MKPFKTKDAKPGDRVILRSAPAFPFVFVGRMHGTDLVIRIAEGAIGPWGARTDCICLQKDLALPEEA